MMPPARAVAVVQLRAGSTRLPGKALLPLAGIPLAAQVLRRLRAVPDFAQVVAAVPDQEEDRVFFRLAAECGCVAVAGSRDDVLGRFLVALDAYPGDPVVRFCGDNPLLATHLVPHALAEHARADADWTALTGLPLGCGFEVVRADALRRAAAEAAQPHQREHVTPYLREHPERFRLHQPPSPVAYPAGLRLTVDTADDYALQQRVYDALGGGEKIVALDDAVALLARHPEWLALNAHVQQKPPTSVG